jgi:peptidyl-prolyl cis-trans isomerase SurA
LTAYRCLLLAVLVFPVPGAVVIDRIAVIAGKHVIKSSDIDRDLRITAFLNSEPLAINPASKRKAADRLVDQTIIRDEIASGGYQRATDGEAQAMLGQIRQTRYSGSEVRFRQALSQYGVNEGDLQMQLLWQLTVLRFIDERFRPGILLTDEEVRDYYNLHLAELKREYPKEQGYEALAPRIRTSLEGERINQQFETWLDDARKRDRIEYRPGAFQ